MNPKAKPLVLAMFTLVCAIIPAAGVIPSVIAQEDATSLSEEDLAGSIVSDVLDGDDEVDDEAADDGIVDQDFTDTAATPNPNQDETTVDQAGSNQFGDDTNTQTAIPIIEQDQRAENQAAQLGLNLDLDLIPSPVPTDPTTPECPPGFTLNNNGECEQTTTQAPQCPAGFTFNPATDLCESSTAPTCTVGTFNPATDQCEQRQTQAPA